MIYIKLFENFGNIEIDDILIEYTESSFYCRKDQTDLYITYMTDKFIEISDRLTKFNIDNTIGGSTFLLEGTVIGHVIIPKDKCKNILNDLFSNLVSYKDKDPRLRIIFYGKDGKILFYKNTSFDTYHFNMKEIDNTYNIYGGDVYNLWHDLFKWYINKYTKMNCDNVVRHNSNSYKIPDIKNLIKIVAK